MKPAHGGVITDESVLDFSSNIHPVPAPKEVLDAAHLGVDKSHMYPNSDSSDIRNTISEFSEVPFENVVVGPGVMDLLQKIIAEIKPKQIIVPTPCFSEYPVLHKNIDANLVLHPLDENSGWILDKPPSIQEQSAVIFSNPCNPTGQLYTPDIIKKWLVAVQKSNSWLIVDEAYADFLETGTTGLNPVSSRLIVLRSMNKFYSLPGLRFGYAVMEEVLAQKIINRQPSWPVSQPAIYAVNAISELDSSIVKTRRQNIKTWSDSLKKTLNNIQSFTVFESNMHYFLVRLASTGPSGDTLQAELLKSGIYIRTSAGMPGLTAFYIRISTRLPEENSTLCETIENIISKVAVA